MLFADSGPDPHRCGRKRNIDEEKKKKIGTSRYRRRKWERIDRCGRETQRGRRTWDPPVDRGMPIVSDTI